MSVCECMRVMLCVSVYVRVCVVFAGSRCIEYGIDSVKSRDTI